MNKEQELQNELTELRNKSVVIRNQLNEIGLKKVMPKLKEQYEGRFWKYENGTSSGDHWFIYSFCRKVEDANSGLFDQFETAPDRNEFQINTHGYFHLCQIEITKEEYLHQVDRLIKKSSLLLQWL